MASLYETLLGGGAGGDTYSSILSSTTGSIPGISPTGDATALTPSLTAGQIEALAPYLTPAEVAYVLTTINPLPPRQRTGFVEHITQEAARRDAVNAAARVAGRWAAIQAERRRRNESSWFLGLDLTTGFMENILAPLAGLALGGVIGAGSVYLGHLAGASVGGLLGTSLQLATTAAVAYVGKVGAEYALQGTSSRFQAIATAAGYVGGIVGAAYVTDALYSSAIENLLAKGKQVWRAAGAIPGLGPVVSGVNLVYKVGVTTPALIDTAVSLGGSLLNFGVKTWEAVQTMHVLPYVGVF